MNLRKFQQGGGLDSLFTIYQPLKQAQPTQQAQAESRSPSHKEEKEADKDKLSEKDLFKMIEKLDGLPNEMAALVTDLQDTLEIQKIMGNESGIGDLASTYLSSLYKLKQAKLNQTEYKNAYDRAVNAGNLNDIAITTSGHVVVLDPKTKQLKTLTPQEWASNRTSRKYQPLTNSNILWFRSHDARYINRNELLQIVENGVGLDQVNKMIKDRFQEIGNSTTTSETYYKKGSLIKGYEQLEQLLQLGPEGYYKYTQEMTGPKQEQVKAVFEYIWQTLPANAKTRLMLETKNGTAEEAQQIVGKFIFGGLNYSQKTSTDYLGTENKLYHTGGDGSGKGGSGFDTNVAFKFLQGYGNEENLSINLGTNRSIVVRATSMPLVGSEEHELGTGAALADAMKGSYSGILDFRSVSIGGNVVNTSLLNQVIVSDGKVYSVDYPCVNRGGRIVPDLSKETQDKKNRADQVLRRRGINTTNPEHIKKYFSTINQVYNQHGLQSPYDSAGNINRSTWARFAVVDITTDERVLGRDANKSLLREVSDDFTAENIIRAIKENAKDYESTRKNWLGADALYEGTAWIPVSVSYNAAMATEKLSTAETQVLDQADQAIRTRDRVQLGHRTQ